MRIIKQASLKNRTLLKKIFSILNTKSIDKVALKLTMARNVTHIVQGFYGYCENLNKLVKELVATFTIAIIISFLNFKISILLILFFILILYFYFSYLGPRIRKSKTESRNHK